MKQLREDDIAILKALQESPQGLFLRQITKQAKISSVQNANRRCNKLINKGLVRKENHLYFSTDKIKQLITYSNESFKSINAQGETIATRLHNFGLSYPLKDSLDPNEPAKLISKLDGTEVRLKNNTQGLIRIGRITVKLTTKAIELYSKDIYTDNRTRSIDIEDTLKEEFDRIAFKVERDMVNIRPIKLKRLANNMLVSSIIRQHYAEERHPFAEAAPTSPLILAKSPIDKQRRLGLDMSKGFREWELYHHLTANKDKDTIDQQFNSILDGYTSLLDINRLKDIVGSQEERYSRQMDIVDKLTKQIDLHLKVMQKIDKKLSQRKLGEF